MAKNANAIRLTAGKGRAKGKIIELNGLPQFSMPRMPLARLSGLDWHGYTELQNGNIELLLNMHKPVDSMDQRMADAIGITVDEWLGLPDAVKTRELRNVDQNAAPIPVTFTPGEIHNVPIKLIFDNKFSYRPRLKHSDEMIDVESLAAITNAATAIFNHHTATVNAKIGDQPVKNYTVNDHVPVDALLQSFGVLKLTPQFVIDAKDQNAKKLSHFKVDSGRWSDPKALGDAIRHIQSVERGKAAKATVAEVVADSTNESQTETASKTDSKQTASK